MAVLTSAALFIWFKEYNGWSTPESLAATVGVVIVFRGFADLCIRRLIPWPSLFGADSAQHRGAPPASVSACLDFLNVDGC